MDARQRAEQIALNERLAAAEERQRAIEAARKPTVSFTGAADYANLQFSSYQASQDLYVLRGSHSFKFGGNIQ